MKLTAWIKSLFQPIPEDHSGAWAADFGAGPVAPAEPPQYACALACCPSTVYLASEYPGAFRASQRGAQGL